MFLCGRELHELKHSSDHCLNVVNSPDAHACNFPTYNSHVLWDRYANISMPIMASILCSVLALGQFSPLLRTYGLCVMSTTVWSLQNSTLPAQAKSREQVDCTDDCFYNSSLNLNLHFILLLLPTHQLLSLNEGCTHLQHSCNLSRRKGLLCWGNGRVDLTIA